jgi:hypothetical protein
MKHYKSDDDDVFVHVLSLEGNIRRDVRYDSAGIPLVPQPSPDPQDPLNWPFRRKLNVLVQISIASFLAFFSASLIVSSAPLELWEAT